MSYRFNILDVVVGVGLCAIGFGAVLLFLVANGAVHGTATLLPSTAPELALPVGPAFQPVIGRAIVTDAVLAHRADREVGAAALQLARALTAQYALDTLPGGPLGDVMREVGQMPVLHAARVQGVLGRAIVNGTRRGLAHRPATVEAFLASPENVALIAQVDARGQRMDQEFAATWQAAIGQRLVDAIRAYDQRAGSLQSQLGLAIVRLVQGDATARDTMAASQYQLASLALTESRMASHDMLAPVDQTGSMLTGVVPMEASQARWPEIPIGVLIAALSLVALVFLAGLIVTASAREARARAEFAHRAARWAYHPAT